MPKTGMIFVHVLFHCHVAFWLCLPILNLKSDTVYRDAYYCPKHNSLKTDSDEIKCHNSGCTADKCGKYHWKLCSPFKLA